jgi:hypothetical protein
MTESSAERRVRLETGWLVGGPLLRVPTIRCTTDTHYRHIPLHFFTTNVLLFKFRYNIFIGFRTIKETPGSVASGTPCILHLVTCMDAYLKKNVCTPSLTYRTYTSGVRNKLFSSVKMSNLHISNPSTLRYFYCSQLASCFNPLTP